MKIIWEGVFPAVTTKFTTNDELDLETYNKSITAQIDAGVNGLILGGSLGEASTLTDDEKVELVANTVAVADGTVPVIFNIAEQSTKAAINIAKKVIDAGADGLMLLPPMRYKADDRETITYFAAVAKSVNVPIMIYNNPVDYHINVTIDMFNKLADYENIEAVKESTRDVTNITRMINKFGNRYSILTGVDTLALESLFLGANGWLAGLVNAFPKETVAIYRLAKTGKHEQALAIYRWFMPILELDIHPKLVQYIKLAETYTGLGSEIVRAPRLTIEGSEREKIVSIINNTISTRPTLPAGSWGRL
jgi:1-pyrroline-4-hydroxy-2-carboxylate deaminase